MKAHLFLQIALESVAMDQKTEPSPKFPHRSSRLNHACNCARDFLELRHLRMKLLPSGRRQPVKSRASIVIRQSPFRLDPTLHQHALERGIERSFFYPQHVFGNLLDVLRDSIAMHRTQLGERFEN